jgi:hypothetical protein
MTHRRFFAAITALFIIFALGSGLAWGAEGCDLNRPDRDVEKLFPESTGYKPVVLSIQKLGGDKLLGQLEEKLRTELRGTFEMIDMVYTIYVIYANNEKIGYIHGVNQKGRYGGIQLFLALDLDQRIKSFYIQKMSGAYVDKFTDKNFGKQFVGLNLADFNKYEVATGEATGKVAAIKNPAPEADYDFKRILRGTKKNLILINEFFKMMPELAAKGGAPSK